MLRHQSSQMRSLHSNDRERQENSISRSRTVDLRQRFTDIQNFDQFQSNNVSLKVVTVVQIQDLLQQAVIENDIRDRNKVRIKTSILKKDIQWLDDYPKNKDE